MSDVGSTALLLKRRAERLRSLGKGSHDEATLAVAEFAVGTRRFALPLQRLVVALPLRSVTSVPLAPSHLIGIYRYQGEMVPVMSLPPLLGEVSSLSDSTTLLLVDVGGRIVGFDVERMPSPGELSIAEVDEARRNSARAVVDVGPMDRRVALIDVVKLLVSRHGD